MKRPESETRLMILNAALRRFADCGYAGASVQEIVSHAQVTKPTLYYYFPSKARLYQALVDLAQDERYRLMREASARADSLAGKLEEILSDLFAFMAGNRELMRLTFAAAFAAPGELPAEVDYLTKSRRNFEFMHELVSQGLAAGVLDRRFDSRELAYGLYGQMNFYVMAHLAWPACHFDRPTARRIVDLFLSGAAARPAPGLGRAKRPGRSNQKAAPARPARKQADKQAR